MLDDILDHPFVGADQDEISLLQLVDREFPRVYISGDQAAVERKADKPLHWSEKQVMGYKIPMPREWPLGDQMADHSDDQGYDFEKEESLEEEIM